jgi:hypothetical protein
MKKNVADVIGDKFKAVDIQCDIEDKYLVCSGELRPDYDKGRNPDWNIQVDHFVARDITQTTLFKLTPSFRDGIWVAPAGGIKTCMPRLGSGLGSVELICSEDENELIAFHKNWTGSLDDLRKKNYVFEEIK